jgi:hypothetical protein
LHFPKLNLVLLIVTVLYFSLSLCILHIVTTCTSLNSSSTFLQKKYTCVLLINEVVYFRALPWCTSRN